MAQGSKPAGTADVLHTVQGLKSIAMFDMALRSSGWTGELRGQGPFTVIAPRNDAFSSLPKDDMQKLLTSPAAMNLLLAHYIVRGSIASNNAAGLLSAKTLIGVKLRAESQRGELVINGAQIVEGDIHCTNGIIHVVNGLDPGLVREALAMVEAPKKDVRKQ
jgi:uncharacterized surface protein with fasciclin (FAS1) repeats